MSVYLRERRMAAGLSRSQLAARTRIAPLLVAQVESGSLTPDPHTLNRLLDGLDVPIWYRKHIAILTAGTADRRRPPPGEPDATDFADLRSMLHPACFQQVPTLDVIAANPAYERAFPGLTGGGNLLEWTFTDPAARTVFVDWDVEAQLLVHAFRMLSPLAPAERIAEITDVCRRSPDWDRAWTAEIGPRDLPRTHLLIRDADTEEVRRMSVRLYDPAFPSRPWWLYRLVPSGRARRR